MNNQHNTMTDEKVKFAIDWANKMRADYESENAGSESFLDQAMCLISHMQSLLSAQRSDVPELGIDFNSALSMKDGELIYSKPPTDVDVCGISPDHMTDTDVARIYRNVFGGPRYDALNRMFAAEIAAFRDAQWSDAIRALQTSAPPPSTEAAQESFKEKFDRLAQAIHDAAVRAGIITAGTHLSESQLVFLCSHFSEASSDKAVLTDERSMEIIKATLKHLVEVVSSWGDIGLRDYILNWHKPENIAQEIGLTALLQSATPAMPALTGAQNEANLAETRMNPSNSLVLESAAPAQIPELQEAIVGLRDAAKNFAEDGNQNAYDSMERWAKIIEQIRWSLIENFMHVQAAPAQTVAKLPPLPAPRGYMREYDGRLQFSEGPTAPEDTQRGSGYFTPWAATYDGVQMHDYARAAISSLSVSAQEGEKK